VALAAAMATLPDILLLDEPLLGLDFEGRKKIQDILSESKDKLTILYVTHDLGEVLPFADRLWLIDDGKVVLDCSSMQWSLFKQNWAAAGVRYPEVNSFN